MNVSDGDACDTLIYLIFGICGANKCMVSKDVVGSKRASNRDFWYNTHFCCCFCCSTEKTQSVAICKWPPLVTTHEAVPLLVKHHCTIYCTILWFDLPVFAEMHEMFIFGFLCRCYIYMHCGFLEDPVYVEHKFQLFVAFFFIFFLAESITHIFP